MAEDQQGLPQGWPQAMSNGKCLKDAFRTATAWIEAHAEQINALNVFPVPDGDTGTNMVLTCQAAREEMDRAGDTIPDVMRAIAHGSLMGARGNSGVILSQILRGMARSIDNKAILASHDIGDAFQEGAATAYKGVIKPVEGTILTVIKDMAEAAVLAAAKNDLSLLLDAVVAAGRQSVDRTPSLLPALRLAGVVDAGGFGLFILFDGIRRHVQGESITPTSLGHVHLEATHAPEEGYGYDIQFIIHGDSLDIEAIRGRIAAMGESTLVVGDEQTVKVHTHAHNPGTIIQYGATLGPLSHVIVENMEQQFQQFRQSSEGSPPARPTQELMARQATTSAQLTGIATVVVAAGNGFDKLLKSLDVSAIVSGGQTMNPSTQQILAAIESVQADKVIVLPNNKNIILTAEEARKLSSKSVVVVPTKTIPQGIAALLALNYDADLQTNKAAMEHAATSVRTAEITTAVRASHMDGLDVEKGETIALVDDRLVAAGWQIEDVIMSTLASMGAAQSELLTLYYGDGVQQAEARDLEQRVRQIYPSAETEVVEGGQPHYMYIISAE